MNNKMITEFSEEQLELLLQYTPPYSEQNAENIKALALEKIKQKKPRRPHYRQILIAAALAVFFTFAIGATYYTGDMIKITILNGRIFERMDYVFTPDKEAVGEWEVVDFVQNIDEFEPGETQWKSADLCWLSVTFFDGGTALTTFDMSVHGFNMNADKKIELTGFKEVSAIRWTKGYIEMAYTVPAYTIKNIDGESYMFIQWKSGDYTIRGMRPWYYVFRQTSSEPPSVSAYDYLLQERRNDAPEVTVDLIDGKFYDSMEYEFIPDEKAVGIWQAVDFVYDIDKFDPEVKFWKLSDLVWKDVRFYENGKVLALRKEYDWTKGYIIFEDENTIPAYTIKNIDGESYMFIQWKSGDYTIRGTRPCYYVFKQISSNPPVLVIPKTKPDDTPVYETAIDEKAFGSWEAVDFVNNINKFAADEDERNGAELSWSKITFFEDGRITAVFDGTEKELTREGRYIVMDDNRATCKIKNIDGEDYMFINWQANPFKPNYYVFARSAG